MSNVVLFRFLGGNSDECVSTVKPSTILHDRNMAISKGDAPRITTFLVEDKTILENDGFRKIQDVLISLPGTLAKDDDGKKVTNLFF
jgi:hypothetical protein